MLHWFGREKESLRYSFIYCADLDSSFPLTYALYIMTLEDFVDSLISEKHASTTLEDFQRSDMKQDLLGRLSTFISLKVMTELAKKDPTALTDFQKLTRGDTPAEDVQQFVNTHIDDGASFLAKVLDDFRILYLGLNLS